MIPVGSAIPEGVGVGMDKENDLLWMHENVVGTVKNK